MGNMAAMISIGNVGNVSSMGNVGAMSSMGKMGNVGSMENVGNAGTMISLGNMAAMASLGKMGAWAMGKKGNVSSMRVCAMGNRVNWLQLAQLSRLEYLLRVLIPCVASACAETYWQDKHSLVLLYNNVYHTLFSICPTLHAISLPRKCQSIAEKYNRISSNEFVVYICDWKVSQANCKFVAY